MDWRDTYLNQFKIRGKDFGVADELSSLPDKTERLLNTLASGNDATPTTCTSVLVTCADSGITLNNCTVYQLAHRVTTSAEM